MLYKSVEDANKTLAAELRCRCDMATQEERRRARATLGRGAGTATWPTAW